MQLAFRVNDNRAFARVIQWWDKTPASHVEIVLEYRPQTTCKCVSSSLMDDGVREKEIRVTEPNWEVWQLPDDRFFFNVDYRPLLGVKYDMYGILLQAFRFARDTTKRLWCGEFVALVMGLEQPWRYTPGALYALARSIGVRVS